MTAEDLDRVYGEAINTLRAELPRRKANKAALATAIAGLGEAKIKLRQLEYTARALGRLRPALDGAS